MPINVGILNRRGREWRERPRSAWIPPARRARARRNFRENYNANSSTLHGYTRNVHRVHSSAEGCYTWSKPTCTVTYIRSLFPARIPTRRLCHRIGALQSRYLHITGVWRAGNRPSKYRPSPSGHPPSLSLCRPLQREKRVPGIPSDKNFNMARREPYRAASTCVIFEFYRMKSRNCMVQNTLEI